MRLRSVTKNGAGRSDIDRSILFWPPSPGSISQLQEVSYVLYIAPKDRDLKRLNYDVLEA